MTLSETDLRNEINRRAPSLRIILVVDIEKDYLDAVVGDRWGQYLWSHYKNEHAINDHAEVLPGQLSLF